MPQHLFVSLFMRVTIHTPFLYHICSLLNTNMGRGSLLLVFLLLLLSAMACDCSSFVQKSRAGFLSSPSALSGGACRYGSVAVSLNAGFVAAASSAVILSDGVRCGACLQVRCTKRRICASEGVKVILTDLSRSNETGLVLSRAAFAAMARHGMAKELTKLRRVDVEYKRIPCEYNENMAIRVEEKSQWPSNLAIKFLYQGGQTDIVAVDIAEVGSANWRFMSRDYGPVWSTNRAPSGSLQLRMVVTGGYDGRWVWAQKEVLPANWSAGSVHDLGFQMTDIAEENVLAN